MHLYIIFYLIIFLICGDDRKELVERADWNHSDQKNDNKTTEAIFIIWETLINDQILYLTPKIVIEKQLPLIEYINHDIYKQGLTFVIYPVIDNMQLLMEIYSIKDTDDEREKL